MIFDAERQRAQTARDLPAHVFFGIGALETDEGRRMESGISPSGTRVSRPQRSLTRWKTCTASPTLSCPADTRTSMSVAVHPDEFHATGHRSYPRPPSLLQPKLIRASCPQNAPRYPPGTLPRKCRSAKVIWVGSRHRRWASARSLDDPEARVRRRSGPRRTGLRHGCPDTKTAELVEEARTAEASGRSGCGADGQDSSRDGPGGPESAVLDVGAWLGPNSERLVTFDPAAGNRHCVMLH